MNLARLLQIVGLLAVAALVLARPASADLRLCDQTSYILYTAVGQATKTELDVHGWIRIAPGDCATVVDSGLNKPAYFLYARTSQAHSGPVRAWGGNVQICARDTNFGTKTKLPVKGCPGEDFYRMPFAVIDRRGKTSWQTTFTESRNIKSLHDAKHAGINRLLTDLGYRVNVPGERARDQALDDFHKRMKLSADASDSELFDAMETEAMKAVAPAGYTVCDDAGEPLSVAIGMPKDKTVDTRGWWQLAPGACAHLLTEPLKTDRVYLLAEGKNKRLVVTGGAKLCVAETEFEISAKGACAKGQTAKGFAVMYTSRRPGLVANVGDKGLLPPMSRAQAAGTAK
jgi:uncharacterized membrane protein